MLSSLHSTGFKSGYPAFWFCQPQRPRLQQPVLPNLQFHTPSRGLGFAIYITTQDVSSVKIKLPFTSRAAWLSIQSECPDIRRTIAHLRQGTRPSKKITNIRDVKRYLNVATLARDSLLVVKKQLPFNPFQILDGLLTSLHIKLEHLSCQQLKNVVSRYFYALNLEKAVELTTNICHQCASLLKTQKVCVEQGSSDQPETVGSAFAVDVLKRERQLILVIRECITSFTFTKLIESERHLDLKDAILQLLTEVHPLDGPFAVIRTDPAPGFNTHVSDQLLARHRLSIELGRVKKPKQNSSCRESDTRTWRWSLSNSALTPHHSPLKDPHQKSRFIIQGNVDSKRSVLLLPTTCCWPWAYSFATRAPTEEPYS